MEKARRRRINNCLEQLRALLPFTATMKRDMASLLEQAVEYINTMHIVLNEERPACLSKIYTVYQKKLEEHDYCKKTIAKSAKKRTASGSSCSSTMDPQPSSPQIDRSMLGCLPTPEQSCLEDAAKRRIMVAQGANCSDTHSELVNHTNYRNLNPQQALLLEPMVDHNNNCSQHCPGIPYGSIMGGCRQGPCCANSYGIAPECLLGNCNQYALYHNGGDPPQPTMVNQYTKLYGMTPKNTHGGASYSQSPVLDKASSTSAAEFEISGNQWSENPRNTDTTTARVRDHSAPRLSISDLVYKDADNLKPPSNPPGYAAQQFDPKTMEFSYPTESSQKVNQAQDLLAPMEMSSPSGQKMRSPQFVEVNRLLGNERADMLRGLTYGGRDMGLLLRASSVSNMLNDVSTTPSDGAPRGSYGSTEKKMTPYLGWLRTPCPPRTDGNTTEAGSLAATYASNDSFKSAGANGDEGADARLSGLIHPPDVGGAESNEPRQ